MNQLPSTQNTSMGDDQSATQPQHTRGSDGYGDGKKTFDNRRGATKQLIERYYYQLTDGCGDSECTNDYCASSKTFRRHGTTRTELAILALELYRSDARLCVTNRESSLAVGGESSRPMEVSDSPTESNLPEDHKAQVVEAGATPFSPFLTSDSSNIKFLTEEHLLHVIKECEQANNWSQLIRTIGEVYSSLDSLWLSFRKIPVEKEEIREMEGEDKDEDENLESDDEQTNSIRDDDEADLMAAVQLAPSVSQEHVDVTADCEVDIESMHRAYDALSNIPNQPFLSALSNALRILAKTIELVYKYGKDNENERKFVNIFVIVMELPFLQSVEYVESVYPMICSVISGLGNKGQSKLAMVWSTFEQQRLQKLLESLQQLVSVRVISNEHLWRAPSSSQVNSDDKIVSAVKVMKIVFYASLLGGQWDSHKLLLLEQQRSSQETDLENLLHGAIPHELKDPKPIKVDPLAEALGILPINCRVPLIKHSEFINEPLNDCIDVATDYAYYRVEGSNKFSFINHNFIVTTANKELSMYYDNRMRMLNERRTSLIRAIVHLSMTSPYLRLRVRRDHLVSDSLVGLEMVAMDNPQDLKKQLIVEFEGEQGLDEGGVSKEFFQLIVEQMFNPDYGMFTYNEDTNQVWFNPTSFENEAQFVLIGIILGLAIYNNAILDIHFPFVVYRKLLGKLGTFKDLSDLDPVLHRSLQDILTYEGDVESAFMQTFEIGYHDVFGVQLTHDLKPNGHSIPVTNDNRQEFVDLYCDFLLNISISKQFQAFKHGFHMVTNESPLESWFRPDEIELLVCGSSVFDFNALEDTTQYDGGFDRTSPTIRNFWEVVHDMSDEQKRKLLQFSTGTDRVPVGGLEKLKLIIARNGPDSDRLPTSHTCFNVLLLPDYNSKDKLQERLLKAITYAKGFGML